MSILKTIIIWALCIILVSALCYRVRVVTIEEIQSNVISQCNEVWKKHPDRADKCIYDVMEITGLHP